MPQSLTPPFSIGQSEDSFWVQDAKGLRFGFCYIHSTSQIGTEPGRLDRDLALRTVRGIKRMVEGWAKS